MSKEKREVIEELEEIRNKMGNVLEKWRDLNKKEFFELNEGYPKSLPSFDEFLLEMDEWIRKIKK